MPCGLRCGLGASSLTRLSTPNRAVPLVATGIAAPPRHWSAPRSQHNTDCRRILRYAWALSPSASVERRRGAERLRYGCPVRVLVIDNYDSFTYNLVQYLGELGAEVEVVRNDHATVAELLLRGHDRMIVSPGPCTPDQAGISLEAVLRFPQAGIPTLGVCLGHQAMVQAFGGKVIRHQPVHGKTSPIEHDGHTIFHGLHQPLQVGRYHSLVADPALPQALERSAYGGGVVMAVRHRELPAEGVQFHPESVLTEQGRELLGNFLTGVR